MMLKDEIYRLDNCVAYSDHTDYTISLITDCRIYRGHFPGNPITPGVVMIAIARELLEYSFSSNLHLIKASSVKYMAILSPIQSPVVCYSIRTVTNDDRTIQARISIAHNETTFSRMSLTFATY